MAFSIFICFAAFVGLVWILRREGVSLGLPIAYLFSLLLIHVPGAIAHLVGGNVLLASELTELGIGFAAIGASCFVAGVWLAGLSAVSVPAHRAPNPNRFYWFCVIGGWLFTYSLVFLRDIPTLGALVNKGGAVWILGVMLGLRDSIKRGDSIASGIWVGALLVYPVLMLLLGGFLSYGSAAMIIAVSLLAISTRSNWRVAVGIIVASVLSFHIFLSYFQNRDEIRASVWGGESLDVRIDASMGMVRDFRWFDKSDAGQLNALDQRLNQNYFVGLAATRIEDGEVDYLYGRSVWEGLLALVPRAMWPDKPVFGGSPAIVSEMTGLVLSEETSFGVGNVMEFYINFGIAGLIVGFVLLGWLLGWLDRMAATVERSGELEKMFVYFLPTVALIQPNGSMVEMAGGAGAAWVVAHGWKWAWTTWSRYHADPTIVSDSEARRGP